MAGLYEITGAYLEVLDMLNDPDADEEMIRDTLESISGELEDKAENYAKIIRNLESLRDSRIAESKRLSDSAKTLDNNIKRLKENLYNSMKVTGKEKFNTSLFSFNIVKNRWQVAFRNHR